MKVQSLGYIVFESPDPSPWAAFARDFIGAQASSGEGGDVQIRFDDRHYRMRVKAGETFRLACAGWEVANRVEFESGLQRLDDLQVKYEELTSDECRDRHIEAGVSFADPLGTQTEVYFGGHGLVEPIALGFGIDSLCLGHLVFGTENQEAMLERFYVDALGFKVSDYLEFPYGSITLRATFLRAGDGRHHSLAFVDVGLGLEHVALNVGDLNDVGRAWDRAIDTDVPIVENLGRHSNSLEVSFYVVGPDDAQFEYGTGPLIVKDDQAWQVRRLNAGSLWGHRVKEELSNLH